MKKVFTFFFTLITVGSFAQSKGHYTPSGGLMGGANIYNFRVKNFDALDYKSKWGFDAGAWLNLPLGKVISIEPQLMYSSRTFTPSDASNTAAQGKTGFFSVPLFLKIGLGKGFSIMAGPQFDFLASYKDNRNVYTKDDWRNNVTSFTGGLEVAPHARLTGYVRANFGGKDLFTFDDNNSAINPKPEYKMFGIHFGLKFKLFGKYKEPVAPVIPEPVVVPPSDSDGDGINDNEDKCPNEPGIPKYQGCPIPDTDGDGIDDEKDKCPTVKGIAKYEGCPIPDTDGDGINDEEDKCPSVAGISKYEGCPIPDTDGDGINDEEDKCKNTPGIAENKGCPEMIFYYKRDVATLTPEEKADLDKLVEWMERHPDLSISIEGHTSTMGTADYNQKLSEKRAQNSVKYLISKGVDGSRLKAVGHGEKFPVGDNSKPEGRAKSRRVVIKIAD